MGDLYAGYARLRGWRITVAKIAVVALLVFLTSGYPLLATWVLTIAVLDAYVKRPVRDGRPLADVGLGPRGALPATALGFGVGVLLIAAAIAILWGAGWYEVTAYAWDDSVGRAAGAFGSAVLLFASVAVLEEVVARGMILRWLEPRTGTWVALLVSSLVFGLLHLFNPGADVLVTLALALEAGLILGGAYLATRTLWWPIGIHWSWNLVMGPVFGVPVSGLEMDGLVRGELTGPELWTGGDFGPEGGLVLLTLGTLTGLGFVVVAVVRGQIVGRRTPEA